LIIKFLLGIGFVGAAVFFLSAKSAALLRAWQKIGFALFVGCALIAVMFPNLTTDIAEPLGVKRGADLLIYITAFTLPIFGLAVYAKFRVEYLRMVELARRVAFLESELDAVRREADLLHNEP
jgi:small membrane protein